MRDGVVRRAHEGEGQTAGVLGLSECCDLSRAHSDSDGARNRAFNSVNVRVLVNRDQIYARLDQLGDVTVAAFAYGTDGSRPIDVHAVTRAQETRHTAGHIHADCKGAHAFGQAGGQACAFTWLRDLDGHDRLTRFHRTQDVAHVGVVIREKLFAGFEHASRHGIFRPFDQNDVLWVEFLAVFHRGFRNHDIDGFNRRFGGLAFLRQGALIAFDIVLRHVDGETGQADTDKQNDCKNTTHGVPHFLCHLGIRDEGASRMWRNNGKGGLVLRRFAQKALAHETREKSGTAAPDRILTCWSQRPIRPRQLMVL